MWHAGQSQAAAVFSILATPAVSGIPAVRKVPVARDTAYMLAVGSAPAIQLAVGSAPAACSSSQDGRSAWQELLLSRVSLHGVSSHLHTFAHT